MASRAKKKQQRTAKGERRAVKKTVEPLRPSNVPARESRWRSLGFGRDQARAQSQTKRLVEAAKAARGTQEEGEADRG